MRVAKGVTIRLESDHGAELFEVFWDAFRALFPKYAKGYEQLKICNSLGEKLESVSMPVLDSKTEERSLLYGAQELVLVSAEFARLKQMIEDEAIGWPFNKGQKVQRTIEFLREQKEVEFDLTESK